MCATQTTRVLDIVLPAPLIYLFQTSATSRSTIVVSHESAILNFLVKVQMEFAQLPEFNRRNLEIDEIAIPITSRMETITRSFSLDWMQQFVSGFERKTLRPNPCASLQAGTFGIILPANTPKYLKDTAGSDLTHLNWNIFKKKRFTQWINQQT